MFLDFGMSELLLIGIVALVFIGPKDLPKALRVAGFWVRKARTLSREFQSSVEQMIREAELDEMRQELKKATEIDLERQFRETIDPTGSLAESLKPPELPKFSDADLQAASVPEAQAVTESTTTESATPPSNARVDDVELRKGESLGESTVAPAEAGVQKSLQSPAAPGFPLARE
jgi:sec-independent protein translocase protein TatB